MIFNLWKKLAADPVDATAPFDLSPTPARPIWARTMNPRARAAAIPSPAEMARSRGWAKLPPMDPRGGLQAASQRIFLSPHDVVGKEEKQMTPLIESSEQLPPTAVGGLKLHRTEFGPGYAHGYALGPKSRYPGVAADPHPLAVATPGLPAAKPIPKNIGGFAKGGAEKDPTESFTVPPQPELPRWARTWNPRARAAMLPSSAARATLPGWSSLPPRDPRGRIYPASELVRAATKTKADSDVLRPGHLPPGAVGGLKVHKLVTYPSDRSQGPETIAYPLNAETVKAINAHRAQPQFSYDELPGKLKLPAGFYEESPVTGAAKAAPKIPMGTVKGGSDLADSASRTKLALEALWAR